MLRISVALLPQYSEKMFALKTNRLIHVDGEQIDEGSYVIVDPKDKAVSDGRVMVLDLGIGYEIRKCVFKGKTVWLMSLTNSEPMALHQDDLSRHVVGFASMFMPIPK